MPTFDYLDRLEAAAGARAATDIERERARAQIERDYQTWNRALFPRQMRYPFVARHDALWDWLWALTPGYRPSAFVAIWSRGGGKSSSAEAGVAAVAAREQRRYGLYVSGTQPQADRHIQAVASLLESPAMEHYYPGVAQRDVNKYGSSKGWRRDRLRTASGFTLDGIGLDVAARGFKADDARPDLIIMDDIDSRHDSVAVVRKKIETLSESILPTGSDDVAVLFIQNRVHKDSIASSFADGTNTFLIDHTLSGPHPAVEGLAVESREMPDGRRRYFIIAGRATWPGQSLETCEQQINDWGLQAFKAEAQHERAEQPGGIFSHLDYRHVARAQLPDLVRTSVWVDPAVSNTDDSDCMAISAAGIDYDDIIYALHSWEARTSPEDALRRAILLAIEWHSPTVGVETDQGGDAWLSVYWRAAEALQREMEAMGRELPYLPRFRAAKAGSYGSKLARASQMVPDYERGEIVHVLGTHEVREAALFRFPKTKPFDLTDASFWSWADLRGMIPDDDNEGPGLVLTGSAAGWFGGSSNGDSGNGYHNGNGHGDLLDLDHGEYASEGERYR